MKKIILIALYLGVLSCGKSIYYVYDTSKDEDHYSYCTLEITSKKEIIYRAASYKYWALSDPRNSYIYIYSDKSATDINENHYSFVSGISDISYIRSRYEPEFKHFFIHFVDKPGYSVLYRRGVSDTIYSTADNDFEYLKEGQGFKENGIKWFPPYMVKVDKIDYTKFGKKIQHLNLNSPKRKK
ncbi:hypothetical protein [Flavobacterium flavigenum]|uniref:hypothetical protein n=1 Tax=Flavobacterium flavigenum TaxID=3003258 RepID=UPI0024823F16|nr:hypothetical protein [Flavobacterium flavigenum]